DGEGPRHRIAATDSRSRGPGDRVNRRGFIGIVIGLIATPLAVVAQPARPFRLAWVTIERAGAPSPGLDAFKAGMRELGYVEGRDYAIAVWWGEGSSAKLEAMAGEIVASGPDIILSQGG